MTWGVVLAGGHGTRLGESTKVANKHTLPIYDRPMIYYPIDALRNMGCTQILIVSGGECIGSIANLLGPNYTYRVQAQAMGIADAIKQAKGIIPPTQKIFPVILGDNYFECPPDSIPDAPTLYVHESSTPERFGVMDYKSRRIVEKPERFISSMVISGLYVYDHLVFDIIQDLKPSSRGELEVTDINNFYLSRDKINLITLPGEWTDMGTPDSLVHAAIHVQAKRRESRGK